MLNEFVSTVYFLVRNGKWGELKEYFALFRRFLDHLDQPHAEVIPGKATEKE